MRIIYFILMLFAISHWNSFAQNKHVTDSIENVIKSTKDNKIKVDALNDLFFEYEFIDDNKANKCLNDALELSRKSNYKGGLAYTYLLMGFSKQNDGNYPDALKNYFSSLKIAEEIKDQTYISNAYNAIGNVYESLNEDTLALKYLLLSLKIDESLNNSEGMGMAYNNIGIVYDKMGNYEESLKNYNKALEISVLLGRESSIAMAYNNMAIVYREKKDYKEALKNQYASLEINQRLEDKKGMAGSLCNIGTILIIQKKYSEAERTLLKALKYSKEIGYDEYTGNIYVVFSRLDSARKNFQGAFENYKLYVMYRDSLNNQETRKKTIQTQMTYEFEKKEAVATAEHRKELENQQSLAEEKSRKQNMVILFIVFGLLLVMVFAGFIFRSLRITRKQKKTIEVQKQIVDDKNIQLNQQNEEIRTQRDEIEAQRDEIEAQRDLVTIQKEEIEEIHKEVTSSINYAKRIQEAVLPVSVESRSVLGEHFILFKPKDIVSGDFYWTTKLNNWLIVAVADCTGHGVPGAFMSMLGISFLNEIVQKKEIHKASHILNILRLEIINALQQKGVQGEQKDGMDISLLVINKDTNECQWAGANNPLYIVTSKQSMVNSHLLSNCEQPTGDFRLFEFKGDKMPIAIYPEMKDFTNHEFVLQKGDCVYLFTDGYADQFGGPKGRKFMYKQFKELLVQYSKSPMIEQEAALEASFNNWIGCGEQIDDVTVLGIRI